MQSLLSFLDTAKTPFHAVQATADALQAAGYLPLQEAAVWALARGGKYYVTRNGSSIIAFSVPQSGFGPVLMAASHSDCPTFCLKETGTTLQAQYTKLNTEGYGGVICSSWFDRPLSVAGCLMVKTQQGIAAKLVDLDRDLLVIPNVAIHMNRTVNDGYKYNMAVDMQPLFGDANAKDLLPQMLAEAAGIAKEDILASDLRLYVRQKSTLIGAQNEFTLAPRLDDLGCAWATLQGLLQAQPTAVALWAMLDNEEVGSRTMQGACSTFLADVLERICLSLGGTREDYLAALAASVMVSADNAHALHPNHPEFGDACNPVHLNGGVVMKYSAAQRYATNAVSAAFFRSICQRAGVPLQVFTNRSDLAGGGTLGNLSAQQVSVHTVDIGLPQLGMHSACETAGTQDVAYMQRALTQFYSANPACFADGEYQL